MTNEVDDGLGTNRRLTRQEYADGLASLVYSGNHQIDSRDLLARLLNHELSHNYDRLGNKKESK